MVKCRQCQTGLAGSFTFASPTGAATHSQSLCRLNVAGFLLGHKDSGMVYSYCQKCWVIQLFRVRVVARYHKKLRKVATASQQTSEQYKVQVSQLESALTEKTKEVQETKDKNSVLVAESNKMVEEMKILKAQDNAGLFKTAVDGILQERNAEIARLLQLCEKTQAELAKRTIDLNQARSETGRLRCELTKICESLTQKQDHSGKTRYEIETVSANESLKRELSQVKEELSKIKSNFEQSSRNAVNQAKEAMRSKHIAELNTSTENYNKLVVNYQQLNGERTAMASQVSRLQEEATKQASSLDMSEKLRKDTELKCSQLNSQVALLSAQFQEAHKQVQSEVSKKEAALQQLQTIKRTMDSEKHFIGIGVNFSDYERLRAHIASWSKELQGYELEPELDRAHTQIKKSLEHTMQAVRIEAEKYTESLLMKEIADKKLRLSQNTEAIMKLETVLGHLSSEEKALSLKPSRDQVEQLTKRLEVLEQLRAGLKTVSAYK